AEGLGRAAASGGQGRLQGRERLQHLPTSDQQVPERFELLPPTCVREVAEPASQIVFGRSATEDGPPTVEVVVGAPVSCLQLGGLQASWFEDHVAGVVSVPIPVQ